MFIVKIHSRCNLNCSYCYMYNLGDTDALTRPKKMSMDVVESLADMVLFHSEQTGRNRFEFVLHGGEPLLVGHAHFENIMSRLTSRLHSLDTRFSIQTNAVLIDREWAELFNRFDIRVGVSLDGPASMNGKYRLFHNGRDSTDQTLEGIRVLREYNVKHFKAILAVFHPESDGKEWIEFFRDEVKIPRLFLLLPDYSWDTLPASWTLQQRDLAENLIKAADTYLSGDRSTFRCSFFDQMLSPEKSCPPLGANEVVIDTDGELQTHDVFRTFADFDVNSKVNVGEGNLDQFYRTPNFQKALNVRGELSGKCVGCPHFTECRAEPVEHRYSKANGFKNPSVHCDALFALISFMKSHEAI